MIATCLQGRAALQKKRLRPSPFHDSLSRSRYFLLRKRPKTAESMQKKYPRRRVRNAGRAVILSQVRFTDGASTPGIDLSKAPFRHSPPATGPGAGWGRGEVARRVGQPGGKTTGAAGSRRPAPHPGHRVAAPGRRKCRSRTRGESPRASGRCLTRYKSGSQHRPERLIFIVLWAYMTLLPLVRRQ